jgi:predicted nucleic acid-binding protein
MYLLDTTVPSDLRKSGRVNPGLLAWVESTPIHLQYLSVITVIELRLGALQKTKNDPPQAIALHRWLDERVLPVFGNRLLPVTLEIAERCATLHVPTQRADRDMLIAATALVNDFTLITRNVRHFEPTGVRVFNPSV